MAVPDNMLTRKDLQEELQRFAQAGLVQAVREAMKDLENDRGPPLQTSLVSRELSQPFHKDRVAIRKSIASMGERENIQKIQNDFLYPSLKHEAKIFQEPARDGSEQLPRRASSREIDIPSVDHPYTSIPLVTAIPSGSYRTHNSLSTWHGKLRRFVESAFFEQCSGMIVVLNAIVMGFNVNYVSEHREDKPPLFDTVVEFCFCVLFFTEWLLRVAAFRCAFFWEDGCAVNWFDTFLVATQVGEKFMILAVHYKTHMVNLGILRLLRLLQIIRFARLFRVLHLFDDLRVMVSAIADSMSSLGWSLGLLLLLIYVFSLIFLQCVVNAGPTEHDEVLTFYFLNLSRTFLTMFECLVGGVNWDHVLRPLASDISPFMSVLFCAYIACSLFAMMNILTGIFVDKAMTQVREDKDVVLARRVRDLFYPKDWQENNQNDERLHIDVTWETFKEKLESQAMQDYFTQISVDIEEARSIFDLMDLDGSGSLSAEEIVRACLRFRGPARSLDLMMIMKDVSDVLMKLTSLEQDLSDLKLRPVM